MGSNLTIREWESEESGKIADIHAKMGMEYAFPGDLGPLFFIKRAVVDENGTTVAGAAVKLVGEAFLWVSPDVSALQRARAVKMLSDECGAAAKSSGLEEVSAWIPPRIERCFSKVLRKLGWRRSPWRSYSVAL